MLFVVLRKEESSSALEGICYALQGPGGGHKSSTWKTESGGHVLLRATLFGLVIHVMLFTFFLSYLS